MSNITATFPEFYPEGVPPDGAVEARGLVYRIVRAIPPNADDFISSLEEHKKLGIQREYGDSLWMACGTSLFKDLADSKRTRDRYKYFRTRKIAHGSLSAVLGKMMDTPVEDKPSHLTAWFYSGAKPYEHVKGDAELGE